MDSDLEDVKLRKEREKILEEKSNTMSEVVKVALERIMSGEKARGEWFPLIFQVW